MVAFWRALNPISSKKSFYKTVSDKGPKWKILFRIDMKIYTVFLWHEHSKQLFYDMNTLKSYSMVWILKELFCDMNTWNSYSMIQIIKQWFFAMNT